MAWIQVIDEQQAEGALRDCYADYLEKTGGTTVANIIKIQSLSPAALSSHLDLYRVLAFGKGPLKRYQRELIATRVSSLNQCHY